jgi:hypothetical protein
METLLENPELFYENPEEARVLRELDKLGIVNEPEPDYCPNCGADSEHFGQCGGYVGETIIYCSNCGSLIWSDDEEAIRNAI